MFPTRNNLCIHGFLTGTPDDAPFINGTTKLKEIVEYFVECDPNDVHVTWSNLTGYVITAKNEDKVPQFGFAAVHLILSLMKNTKPFSVLDVVRCTWDSETINILMEAGY